MLLRIPSSSGFGVMDAYTAFGIHDSTVVFKSQKQCKQVNSEKTEKKIKFLLTEF